MVAATWSAPTTTFRKPSARIVTRQERQNLSVAGIDPKEPRRGTEALRFKVAEQSMNERRIGADRSSYRISDPDDARRRSATLQRNLALRHVGLTYQVFSCEVLVRCKPQLRGVLAVRSKPHALPASHKFRARPAGCARNGGGLLLGGRLIVDFFATAAGRSLR